jgi:hypothetical protein
MPKPMTRGDSELRNPDQQPVHASLSAGGLRPALAFCATNSASAAHEPGTKSGAEATALQTLARRPGALEPREAFGVRRVHRRFSAGAFPPLLIQGFNSRKLVFGNCFQESRVWSSPFTRPARQMPPDRLKSELRTPGASKRFLAAIRNNMPEDFLHAPARPPI